MTLQGTIDQIGNDLCVKYVSTLLSEPVKQTLWWKITRVERKPMGTKFPQVGDKVTSGHDTAWNTPEYRVYIAGDDAIKVERTPIPCPKVGKNKNSLPIETRWNSELGRWEKLMARGWLPA